MSLLGFLGGKESAIFPPLLKLIHLTERKKASETETLKARKTS